ncbi:hypothetical protein QNE83_002769 [Vibrio alginolyticus]|nr:hypothetical protein [Vibrio alginolyticus]ELB2869903.1 hypothetical protein [Vibrio alginolyticus]
MTTTVNLDSQLVASAQVNAANRSVAEQIEHWANIGKMMEENQDLLIKLYAALRCDSSDESV